MASQRQIEANRRNAQKSTGPKTAEGKLASSANSLKHGFAAERFTVFHEDESEFEFFRDGLFAEHQPKTPTETFLVEQMVAAGWRLRRLRDVEAAYWTMKIADGEEGFEDEYKNIGDAGYLAYALQHRFNRGGFADNLSRYESRLERSFYKALHELERLRRENRAAAPEAHAATPDPVPSGRIGFVSPEPATGPRLVPQPPQPTEPAPETPPHPQLL